MEDDESVEDVEESDEDEIIEPREDVATTLAGFTVKKEATFCFFNSTSLLVSLVVGVAFK